MLIWYIFLVFVCKCNVLQGVLGSKDDSTKLKDHVKPFGAHRPAEDGLKILKYSPSGSDFYHRFVHGRRPVVVRGAANHWPAMSRWNNESYLRENYGSSPFYVEFRKKFKNEQPIRKPMKLQDFLNIYKNQEVYLDSLFPPTKMFHDLVLPYFLGCSELASKINSLNLLMSSGDTTSAFHQDGYENVITVLSGTKTFILIDSKYAEKLYAEEHFLFPGILAFDPEAIDFKSFPKLVEVPYYKVTLYPGDMLYIPQYWWHIVWSKGSPNIAVNIWFDQFNFEDDFVNAGLDENKDIIKVNEMFNTLVKKQPERIECDHENPHLNVILKINISDPVTQYLRIPKKNERPPDVVLASGFTMPVMGFGTALLKDTVTSVKTALKIGYRMIDTAQAYINSEKDVAQAIAESGVPRSDIFIITKLHPKYLGYDSTINAIEASLKALNTDYIDLFLIHSKTCDTLFLTCEKGEPKGTWKESWKAMEDMQKKGKLRSLGVSNFNQDKLQELIEFATVPVSAVQNWFDPFHQDKNTRQFCSEHNIRYIGFSTLGTRWVYFYGLKKNPVLKSTIIYEVAAHYEYATSQVVLRWAIHSNVTVIPRSSNPRNIYLNFRALDLELTESERETITDVVDYELHPLERIERGEAKCEDEDEKCGEWAESGRCIDDPDWMLTYCRQSCKQCVLDNISKFQPFVYVGSEDNNMYAVGILYGDLQWKFPTKGKILSTAAFSPDSERLFFGSNDGNIYAVAASTGKLFWSVQTKGGVVASPSVSKTGTIYVGSHDGYLYSLDSDNGTTIWRKSLGGPIYGRVALGEEKGALYAGTSADKGPRVFALDMKTGEVLWQFDKAGKIMSSPAVSADGKVVYFCSLDKNIYALDTDTGSPIWTLDTGSEIESSPYVSKADGTLYVGLISGKILAVNTHAGPLRGTVKWTLDAGGEVVSSPTVTESGKIFVGVGDGRVLAINQTTTDIIWGPATKDYVSASTAVGTDSVVYAASTDSTLYALNENDGSVIWTFKTNGSISLSSPAIPKYYSTTLA
ncbi:uncharacterized protein LOC116291382 [Actinia tenebrosa]|uniref:Uncharacterized protein LOC116291382 n=1 Tax=Actinia tenebrosa TaxID=6105 RepID=A0A6P8HF83_ACTTE|nr:uncharacterized protein LOC116291382 [Actinia tenebrosa]